MKTSNFAVSAKNPNAVAICRGKPKWYKGRTFDALAPTWEMLKMNEVDFESAYRARLARLNLKEVYQELGENAVLLC